MPSNQKVIQLAMPNPTEETKRRIKEVLDKKWWGQRSYLWWMAWAGDEGGNDGLAIVEAERGVGMQTVSQLLGEDHSTKCMRSKERGVSVCGVCVCVRGGRWWEREPWTVRQEALVHEFKVVCVCVCVCMWCTVCVCVCVRGGRWWGELWTARQEALVLSLSLFGLGNYWSASIRWLPTPKTPVILLYII